MGKNSYSSLLKIKIFRNKRYHVMIFVYEFNSNILSRDSNYTVDVVKW